MLVMVNVMVFIVALVVVLYDDGVGGGGGDVGVGSAGGEGGGGALVSGVGRLSTPRWPDSRLRQPNLAQPLTFRP